MKVLGIFSLVYAVSLMLVVIALVPFGTLAIFYYFASTIVFLLFLPPGKISGTLGNIGIILRKILKR